jgi:hypothetical protein
MYRRVAFAAAALALAAGGVLVVWAVLRPHADVQRMYGAALGLVGLLVGGVQLLGAMSIPAAVDQTTWRGLRPRWPVITGVVVIAMVAVGVGMVAAVAITSPDPPSGPQPAAPLRVPDSRPVPDSQPAPDTAPDTLPRRPP